MRIISEHAEYAVRSIMHTIAQDSGSWEGWQCLKLETPGLAACGNRRAVQSNLCSIFESHLQEKEGTVFLHGFEGVIVFCKGISASTLKSIGGQILEMIAEEAGLTANFACFDICEDSVRLMDTYTHDNPPKADGNKTTLSFRARPFRFSGFQKEKTALRSVTASRKVLLVEDDPAMRWMVRSVLKNECQLVTAQDVNGAISIYRAYKPDIVLLDLNLCGKDGKEAMVGIIRSDPGAHIVIFSGADSLENIAGLLEEGAKGFIAKPFRKEKLLQYVHAAPALRI